MSVPETSTLITVEHAIAILDQTPVFPRIVRVSLEQSVGLRLAEDLKADRDFPPFRKSMMDGYAVRSADVAQGQAELRVMGEIAAGRWPDAALQPGETMAIMTGAPLPDGADGVVPVEDVEARVAVGSIVRILRAKTPQRFVAARGSDCPVGHVVLSKGMLIGPAQIAVAASIGAAELSCFARPRVAVLGTGDELVPVDQTPTAAQIRDSNTPMLAALLRRLGCEVVEISSVPDDPHRIADAIRRGMAYDALFIAGGMSMGEYDYVPRLLVELGVELKITKLRIKPGKPFVFGVAGGAGDAERGDGGTAGRGDGGTKTHEEDTPHPSDSFPPSHRPTVSSSPAPSFSPSHRPTVSPSPAPSFSPSHRPPVSPSPAPSFSPSHRPTVSPSPAPSFSPSHRPTVSPSPRSPCFLFGLPGNPVSAFVCTIRLASRLLTRMAGGEVEERWIMGKLAGGLPANGPREFYQPAICKVPHGRHSGQSIFSTITPLNWKGSADLFTLASANALLVRAENEPPLPSGSIVRVLEI